jgi:hypothetical protein
MTTVWKAFAIVLIAGAGGCASSPSHSNLIEVRSSEGIRWIVAEDVQRYACDGAALVCSADGGRLSERRCQCSPGR